MPPVVKIAVLALLLRVLVRWPHLHLLRLHGVHGVALADAKNHIICVLRIGVFANHRQRLELIVDFMILPEQLCLGLLLIVIKLWWLESGILELLLYCSLLSPLFHQMPSLQGLLACRMLAQSALLLRFLVKFEGLDIRVDDVKLHRPLVIADERLGSNVALLAFMELGFLT